MSIRRPWRKVVRAEPFEYELPYYGHCLNLGLPKGTMVKLNRLFLSCGHYTTERRYSSGRCSSKVRCHICQTKKEPV